MFDTKLAVRISDINYGNHLAHDRLVTLMHEARLQFFADLGESESHFYGVGLILKSLQVEYRKEAFYPDLLTFSIAVDEIRNSAFSLSYQVQNEQAEKIAEANLVLVAYDYQKQKIARLPSRAKQSLEQYLRKNVE